MDINEVNHYISKILNEEEKWLVYDQKEIDENPGLEPSSFNKRDMGNILMSYLRQDYEGNTEQICRKLLDLLTEETIISFLREKGNIVKEV